jgi:hypothetical protein
LDSFLPPFAPPSPFPVRAQLLDLLNKLGDAHAFPVSATPGDTVAASVLNLTQSADAADVAVNGMFLSQITVGFM